MALPGGTPPQLEGPPLGQRQLEYHPASVEDENPQPNQGIQLQLEGPHSGQHQLEYDPDSMEVEKPLFVPPQNQETGAVGGKGEVPTKIQENAVKRIMNCNDNEWYAILDVADTCSKEEANTEYKKLVLLVHPDRNPHPQAKHAFDKVYNAADKLKAGDDYEAETNEGPDGPRATPDSIPEPTAFQKGLYETAYDHMMEFLNDPEDKDAKNALSSINKDIREQNRRDGKSEDNGIIHFEKYLVHLRMIHGFADILSQDPTGQPSDVQKQHRQAVVSAWKTAKIIDSLNQMYHYPRSWNLEDFSNSPENLPDDPAEWKSHSMEQQVGLPIDPEQAGTGPAGTGPAGTAPAGTALPGKTPPGTAPPGTAPPGKAPPGRAPAGTGPAGTGPAGTGPAGTGLAGTGPAGTAPPGTAPPGAAPPSNLPAEYTTEKGFPFRGIRRAGPRGYQLVVENGKPWDTDNCLDLKSGGDLGYGWVDTLVKDINIKGQWAKWDLKDSKKKITREDAVFFTRIKGIASNPIRTRTINAKPRYPGLYSLTEFGKTTESGQIEQQWYHLLDRSALEKLLGRGAADIKIKEFYTDRNLTPPWEVGPKAITTGKPRAIDFITTQLENTSLSATNPAMTAAPAPAPAPALVAPALFAPTPAPAGLPPMKPAVPATVVPPQPPPTGQLLLTNKVEGLAEQVAAMMNLIQSLAAQQAPPQAPASQEYAMA